MSVSIDMPMLGLALDQHPGAAPKGAMSQADNVVGDLPGILRGRPNTDIIASEATYTRPDTLIRVGETWLAHQAGGAWTNAGGELTGIDAGGFADMPAASAEARGSTYIATIDGVAKYAASDATVMVSAGIEMSLASFAGNLPRVVPSGSVPEPPAGPFTSPFTVGYRLVVKRTDANGYVARSAPSPLLPVYSPGASTYTDAAIILFGDAQVSRWYFAAGSLREGDIVEFYRSRILTTGNDGPIAPDMYLVTTYEVTAANVTAGYFPASGSARYVYDTLEDDQLGEALYTNPARGGALAAKYPPPAGRAIALWSGAMWYGYVQERERALFQLVSVGGGTPANQASDGQSLGVTTLTCGITNGLPQITVASSVAGIRVGMYVTDSASGPQVAGDFPALTQVLSIAGAGPWTVTVDKNATLTDAAAVLYFGDYIDIDEERFYASIGTSSLNDREFAVSDNADPGFRAAATADSLARAVNSWMVVNDGDVRITGTNPVLATSVGVSGLFVVEAATPTGQFTVGPTSAPYAFAPAIEKEVPYGATIRKNRVYFSDLDEPEAVRLLSFIDIGASQHEIIALTPLRDALLVWKADGLYRITGVGPNGWSVDILDSTLVLSRPTAVDVLRGVAYAVTNRGFVVVNEGGISGMPAQGKVETLFREPRQPVVVAWEQLGLVLIAEAVDTQSETYTDTVYCFAVATGVWSRWPVQGSSAWGSAGRTYSPLMAHHNPDGAPVFEIREWSNSTRGYDEVWQAVQYTGAADVVTVAESDRGDWYPAVGDWLYFDATGPGPWYGLAQNAGPLWPGAGGLVYALGPDEAWPDSPPEYDVDLDLGELGASETVEVTGKDGGDPNKLLVDPPLAGEYLSGTARVRLSSVEGPAVPYFVRVIGVEIDGSDWNLTVDGTVPGVGHTITVYEGAPVQLEWLPATAGSGSPFSLPLWREATFSFSGGPAEVLAELNARITIGVRHDQNQTVAEKVGTPIRSVSAMRPYRMGWPREGARRAVVWLRLGFSEIDWPWRLSGVSYVGEGGSEKVRR
jgi:hypothetical protein